ncbi:MAG: hypothetical protein ACKO2G_08765 [Verrucomicrobiales bacterium]
MPAKSEFHLLNWLRGSPVELPGDVIALRVGFDPELDRFVGFGIGDFVMFHDGCQVGRFHARLTTSCHLGRKTKLVYGNISIGASFAPSSALARRLGCAIV